jgi:hypothetical protein
MKRIASLVTIVIFLLLALGSQWPEQMFYYIFPCDGLVEINSNNCFALNLSVRSFDQQGNSVDAKIEVTAIYNKFVKREEDDIVYCFAEPHHLLEDLYQTEIDETTVIFIPQQCFAYENESIFISIVVNDERFCSNYIATPKVISAYDLISGNQSEDLSMDIKTLPKK